MAWIRSQDKTRLVECICFEIGQETSAIFGYAINGSLILGKYSTEEKALKVLDMIQKYIGGKTKYYIAQDIGNPNGYHVVDDMNIPMFYCKDGIFQMPADEEVF